MADVQQKEADLRRFHQDVENYETNREDLLDEYPEQWVAIFREQVVAADPDYDRLLDQVEEKGIRVGKVFIQQVTAKDELLILGL
jgi:hypothetical protein